MLVASTKSANTDADALQITDADAVQVLIAAYQKENERLLLECKVGRAHLRQYLYFCTSELVQKCKY